MPSPLITDMLNNDVYLTVCMYASMYVCMWIWEIFRISICDVMRYSVAKKSAYKRAGCNSENGQEMALRLLRAATGVRSRAGRISACSLMWFTWLRGQPACIRQDGHNVLEHEFDPGELFASPVPPSEGLLAYLCNGLAQRNIFLVGIVANHSVRSGFNSSVPCQHNPATP